MAKFLCVCGEAIWTSGDIPNPIEIRIMRDREMPDQGFSWQTFTDAATYGDECPKCGHLWIFWDGFEADPKGYSPLPA